MPSVGCFAMETTAIEKGIRPCPSLRRNVQRVETRHSVVIKVGIIKTSPSRGRDAESRTIVGLFARENQLQSTSLRSRYFDFRVEVRDSALRIDNSPFDQHVSFGPMYLQIPRSDRSNQTASSHPPG
jgi:hypothetical protein